MKFRPDPSNWVYAVIGVMALALYTTMQVTDGVFHPLAFIFAIVVVSGFLLFGLALWGVLRLIIRAVRGHRSDDEPGSGPGPDRIRFYWLLTAAKVAVVLGWLPLWLADGGQPDRGKVTGLLVVVGLVLALGGWFIWLTRERDDDIPTLVVVDPGGPGREPVLRPYRRSYASLLPPWFLLPVILVFGYLGVVTGNSVLFLVPVAVAIGLAIFMAVYAAWWLKTYE